MTNETKTDFSEWLVASDIDGTLNNKFRKLPQRNYDAIKEFVVNKKGAFHFGVRQKYCNNARSFYGTADYINTGCYIKRRGSL